MIDTQAIRRKILDLAMRGKLTERRPEDGTAEELYRQIRAEKQALIKAGKIKKEKPLPEIAADEIPFEVPASWKWVRIGAAFHVEMGQSPDGTSVLRNGEGMEFHQGKIFFGAKYINDSNQRTTMPTKIADANSVLVCVRAPVGKVNITQRRICIGRGLCAITPVSAIDLDYLYHYLVTCEKAFADQGTGSTFSAIGGDIIKKQLCPLPPLAEQQRIVARIEQTFSALDTIDALQAKYADNLAALKSKLIDAAIQGKLTEQLPEDGTAEELYRQIQAEKQALVKARKIKKEKPLPEISANEIPFEIPENWKWIRWGDIVNIVSARRVHQADWRKTGVPFYRAREIAKLSENGYVKNELFISEELYEEFSKSGVPHENDLMVSAVGTLGKTYVVQKDDRFYYKDASVLCFENFGNLNPYFLAFIMKSNVMRTQIESNSGGTTVDTLTMVRMVKYLIPLPPLAEQKRIVAKLEELLPLCDEMRKV